jgi:hypothetical protein
MVSIVCDGFAIISGILVVLRIIINYKVGIKFEYKFGIPRELYRFNLSEMLIETSEYILMFFTLFSIIYLVLNDFFIPVKEDPFRTISNSLILFSVYFLFTIASTDILREKYNLEYKNRSVCCYLLKYVIPQLILSFLCMKFNCIFVMTLVIMIIVSVYCIYRFIKYYVCFDEYKHKIIELDSKYYAVFSLNGKFILSELIKESNADNTYTVKEMGKYTIEENVPMIKIYSGKIAQRNNSNKK